MDKEQKVAYEIIRQRIVNEIDRLESLDKPGSSLKRWRRFGAAFSWDPTVYPEILEKPTVSDKELMSLLRNTETKFMKKWGVIDKIPLHHIIANRTGGDLGLRLPVDTWEEVKERVFDATGARPGNGAANLNAASQFDERSHLGRPGAKGSVFDPALGYGDPADPTRSPILHGPGTKDFGTKLGKDPVILRSSPEDIAKSLTPEIVKQQEIFETVSKDPIVQGQRNVLTQAGYPEAFKPDTPIERIQQISKEIKGTDIPEQFARAFNFSGGSARFGMGSMAIPNKTFGALLPGVGIGFGALDVAERTAKAAETKKPIDALQATLAGAGMTPGVGIVADGGNIVIDTVRFLASPFTRQKITEGAKQSFTGAHTGRY
jgi:hypothetical protein